ncbi:MAG: glycosyltransferase family 4 protein [Polynucleobacter sp.]|nr:glycosyltransferase family 4 protein [Polynucleobacter sp.]
MTRLAHLTSVHPRDDIRIFLKECLSLSTYGYEVFLVVADGYGSGIHRDIKIADVGPPMGRIDRMFNVTHRIFAKALELDADIYHLHDPELLPIGLKLKRLGKRVIFDAHEDVPKQILGKHYIHPWVRHTISWGFAYFERYACSRFDGVVTATPYIREKFLQTNRLSIDINNFPILGEFESPLAWQDKAKEVCYVGNVAQVRGINELVLAMGLTNHDIRLNLVGGFSEKEVEIKVRAYEGWESVNYLGIQDRLGVGEMLRRSIAGLVTLHPIPNYLDSLPIKMFEYMSAGIPVIASNFPLWQEIISKNQCGICVDPMDPLAIANAIDYLIDHPNKARQMGENGRKVVISKYNWAQEEIKLFKFYEQILSA